MVLSIEEHSVARLVLTTAGDIGSVQLAHIYQDLELDASSFERSAGTDEVVPGFYATLCAHRSQDAADRSAVARQRWVVFGGPGQGKSTLTQWAAITSWQRAIREAGLHGVDELIELGFEPGRAQSIARSLELIERRSRSIVPVGGPLWFALRVDLPRFVESLVSSDADESASAEVLLTNATNGLARPTDDAATGEDLRACAERWRALWLFDALDEVVGGRARGWIALLIDAVSRDEHADRQVVVTSRPQGYDGLVDERPRHIEDSSRGSRTLRVRTLSKAQSSAMLRDLVAVEFAEQPTQREHCERAVARAINDPHASELFRTPLFVSIVLQQIVAYDALPASRALLFERMYDTLLARESRKNVGNVRHAVLSNYRWAVAALHERVALVLQVRTDSDGAANGVSTGELRRIASEVVRERVSNVRTREQLVADLLFFAEQRLVLLAQYELQRHRFDVRLVQEYFVSRALFGSTAPLELRVERLRSIAPHESWRQVLVLAASQWADSNDTAMIDALIECCRAGNDERGTSVARSVGLVRTGTEIAVAVLTGGAFDGAPDAAERLWSCALEGAWERARRASLHWTEIAVRFSASHPALRAQLCTAITTGVRDRQAYDLLRHAIALWETDHDREARRAIEAAVLASVGASSWLVSQLLVRQDDDSRALLEWVLSTRTSFDASAWWIANVAKALVSMPLASVRLGAWALWSRAMPAEREPRSEVLSGARLDLAFRSVQRGAITLSEGDIEAMLDLVEHRDAWRAWLEFHQRPCRDTLAAAVDRWSNVPPSDKRSAAVESMWPLAAMLREVADEPASASELIDRARRGDFGDYASWTERENEEVHPRSIQEADTALNWLWFRGCDPRRSVDRTLGNVEDWLHAVRARTMFSRAIVASLAHWMDGRLEYFARLLSAPDVAWLAAQFDVLPFAPSRSMRTQDVVELFASLDQEIDRRPSCFLPRIASTGISGDELSAIFDAIHNAPRIDGPASHRALEPLISFAMPSDQQRTILALRRPSASPEAWAALMFRCPDAPDAVIDDAIAVLTSQGDVAEHYLSRTLQRAEFEYVWRSSGLRASDWLPRFTSLLAASIRVRAGDPVSWLAAVVVQRLIYRLPGPFASPDEITRSKLPIPPSIPTLPAMIEPLVTIQRFTIRNVRSIEAVDVPLASASGERGQWIVLLGDNGVGKTSVLRGLALAMVEPLFAPKAPDHDSLRLVRAAAREGEARVWFRHGARARETACRLSIDASNLESWTCDTENDRPFVVAYGVWRATVDGAAASAVDEPKAIRSLFDHSHTLVSARHWLSTLDGEDAGVINSSLRAALQDALATVGVEDVRLSAEHGFTFTGPAVGSDIALHHLSDGYQSVVAWVSDLMARWVAMRKRARRPIDRDFHQHMAGVVLVDELDQHLHPLWQRDLVQSLRRVFPRLSFVATTHNPQTVIELGDGELFRVHRDEQGDVGIDPLPAVRGRHADDVLTGAWFGLGSTLDDETLAWMEQHRRLLREHGHGELRAELERKIRTRTERYAELAIERIALGVAQELMDEEAAKWSRPERSTAEQREQLRSTLIDRVRQKLEERRKS